MTDIEVLELFNSCASKGVTPYIKHKNGNTYRIVDVCMDKSTGSWVTTVTYWQVQEAGSSKLTFKRLLNQFSNFVPVLGTI